MNSSSKGANFSVGFVLFVATAIVIGGLFWIGSGRSLLSNQKGYYFFCPSSTGLKTGTRVYLQGVPVGMVQSIDFVDDLNVPDVRVTFRVTSRAARRRIRTDSQVSLASEGLLGDVSVHISAGSPDVAELPSGGELRFQETTMVDRLVGGEISGSASLALSELAQILRKLERGQGTIGRLLNDDEIYKRFESLSISIEQLSRGVEATTQEINAMLVDAREKPGALGRLLLGAEDQELLSQTLRSTAKLVGSLERIAQDVDEGPGLAWSLVHDEELATRVKSLLTHLDGGSRSLEVVLELLERGEGSVGRWLHDPTAAVALEDVLLGVREGGYMQNLIRNAERRGRSSVLRSDRASLQARIEASRAEFLASIQPTSSGTPVPSSGGDGESSTSPGTATQPGATESGETKEGEKR